MQYKLYWKVFRKRGYTGRMMQELTNPEMHDVLSRAWHGHLACCDSIKRPYVVPISYAFEHNAIYSFAFEGEKIDIMRRHPHVCFQVEKLMPNDMWKSVIVWGKFEELEGADRGKAMSLLIDRLWKAGNQEKSLYMPFRDSEESMERAMDDHGAILWRIAIEEMHGRMEQYA